MPCHRGEGGSGPAAAAAAAAVSIPPSTLYDHFTRPRRVHLYRNISQYVARLAVCAAGRESRSWPSLPNPSLNTQQGQPNIVTPILENNVQGDSRSLYINLQKDGTPIPTPVHSPHIGRQPYVRASNMMRPIELLTGIHGVHE